jgi:hypothetical protein
MSKKTFTRALAILLTIAFVTPAAFFIAPQRTSADSGVGCIVGLASGLASLIPEKVTAVPVSSIAQGTGVWTTAGSTVGSCIYNLIIVPVLRAMLRAFLQEITKATINWINGANGTGQPSFVRDLSTHLQQVGDVAALSFIAQTATAFNSPFGSAISSSLQTNYSQQTSMAGFFAANQCTLAKSSPNINSFLAGNWSQGGIGAWFALTTQSQNNPYMLYQNAQSQLASAVGSAQAARTTMLNWGQGFLSWCPSGTTSNTSSSAGVKPQPPCTNADGTPAQASTPGSTIKSYLDANLGSGIGQLVSAQDLDSAINAIVTALGNKVIGSTGLFGSSQPSNSSNTTIAASAPSSAATSAISLAQSTLSNITTYSSAWNIIAAAANTASTSVASLVSYCNAQLTSSYASTAVINAQVSAAQIALTSEIAPVLAQAQTAFNAASTAQALALQVQAEATAVPIADPVQFSTDVSSLSSMPPTSGDVVNAQMSSTVSNAAAASPSGSLAVSNGSLVDQMNLISTNATALHASCTPSVPATDNSNGGGQGGN